MLIDMSASYVDLFFCMLPEPLCLLYRVTMVKMVRNKEKENLGKVLVFCSQSICNQATSSSTVDR